MASTDFVATKSKNYENRVAPWPFYRGINITISITNLRNIRHYPDEDFILTPAQFLDLF